MPVQSKLKARLYELVLSSDAAVAVFIVCQFVPSSEICNITDVPVSTVVALPV